MAQTTKRRKLSNDSYEATAPVSTVEPATVKASKAEQHRQLFVRSLPASVTTERLTEHFSQSYPLKHATVVTDPATKISRGYGFVTFVDADDAQAAAAEFSDTVVDGRKIKVEVAQSRHRDIAEDTGKSGINTRAVELKAELEKNRAEKQPPKLIVRNLPWSIKEPDDLAKLFLSYGKVKHAVVPKRGPRAQAGFGFVLLRGRKNAEKALAGVNGKEVDGRTLAVDWAVDKQTWEDLQKESAEQEDDITRTATNEDGRLENKEGEEQDATSREGANGLQTDDDDDDYMEGTGLELDDVDSEDLVEDDTRIDSEEEADSDSEEEPHSPEVQKETRNDTTVFIRNLPFETGDESLRDHFSSFGAIRYARVVFDPETERSRGTGFVCFFNEEDAKSCVRDAPKHEQPSLDTKKDKKRNEKQLTHSILQNEAYDPSGKYTLDGRVLQVTRALSREDADHHMQESKRKREKNDKRRLYLLREGTINRGSKLFDKLGKAELDMRDASAKQRQKLVKTNPNLGLSLTRLSVRNLPRSVDSKTLKALAREAVVGFAKDVSAGLRQPLSREEVQRGGDEMAENEHKRKLKGIGIVKQAKIVYEDPKSGGKVKSAEGGRSRGYGFLDYTSHRSALMGLRWLNGHFVPGADEGDKGKRLIVEFALEDARVLARRKDRESKSRNGPKADRPPKLDEDEKGEVMARKATWNQSTKTRKRKGEDDGDAKAVQSSPKKAKKSQKPATEQAPVAAEGEDKNKLEKRIRIIAKKRQKRKARKGNAWNILDYREMS